MPKFPTVLSFSGITRNMGTCAPSGAPNKLGTNKLGTAVVGTCQNIDTALHLGNVVGVEFCANFILSVVLGPFHIRHVPGTALVE